MDFGWVGGPRHTLVVTWILISIFAAAVAAMLIIPAVLDYRIWVLGQHGVRAPAVVLAVEPDGRTQDYLLQIEVPDAAPLEEWTSDVQAGTTVGQRITVIFDPKDLGNLQDVRDYTRGGLWLAPLLFLPAAGFFAWMLRGLWEDRPTRQSLAALAAAGVSVTGGGFATRLSVPDGSVVSGYPEPVRFVVALRNRARMLWGVLLSGIPLAGAAVSGRGIDPLLRFVFGGLAALMVGLFLAFGRNRAILDPTGVRNRWLVLPESRYAWTDITQLQNRTGSRSRSIQVVPVQGKPFMLAAPLDSPPGSPDPQFDQKAAVIAQYWRDARRGHPHSDDPHSDDPHHGSGHSGPPDHPFRHHGR